MNLQAQWSVPFRLLVEPVQAWKLLKERPVLLPSFTYLAIAAILGWILNARTYSEVAEAAGISPAKLLTTGSVFFICFQVVLAIVLFSLAYAGLIKLTMVAFGNKAGFRDCWVVAVNGSFPLAAGFVYSAVMMFFVKPLSSDLLTALSLLLKPFSLGLASLFPQAFDPLSLTWFVAVYFDLFGIWAVVLTVLGLRHMFGLRLPTLGWQALLLVLSLLLAITALWQVVQTSLLAAV